MKDKSVPAKRRYFDEAFFWRINVSELIADAGVILFSIFFSRYLFKEADILHALKPWEIMGLYAVVVLTLPWYLGYMYAIYEEYYSKFVMRTIMVVFIIIVLFVLVYMVRIMFSSGQMDDNAPADTITTTTDIFSLFLLVLGPMMSIGGLVAGKDDCDTIRKKDTDDDASPTAALLILVLAIAFLAWWVSIPAVQNHGWLALLAYLGCAFPAVIVYGLFLWFKSFLRKMGVYHSLARLAGYLFPFFIIVILILWSDIGQHFIIMDFGNGGKMSFKYLLLSLSIAGFIPFRAILLFQPPLRLINIAIGIGAFIFYLYSISS